MSIIILPLNNLRIYNKKIYKIIKKNSHERIAFFLSSGAPMQLYYSKKWNDKSMIESKVLELFILELNL